MNVQRRSCDLHSSAGDNTQPVRYVVPLRRPWVMVAFSFAMPKTDYATPVLDFECPARIMSVFFKEPFAKRSAGMSRRCLTTAQ